MSRKNQQAIELPRDLDITSERGKELLNERLRKLAASASGATASRVSTAAVEQLALHVPFVLAIEAAAAPLAELPADMRFREVSARVKQAPAGGSLKAEVKAGGATVASITIPAGALSAIQPVSGTLPGKTEIRLDITSVGLTFPGADLTVIVR
jgi:hypothetical protein